MVASGGSQFHFFVLSGYNDRERVVVVEIGESHVEIAFRNGRGGERQHTVGLEQTQFSGRYIAVFVEDLRLIHLRIANNPAQTPVSSLLLGRMQQLSRNCCAGLRCGVAVSELLADVGQHDGCQDRQQLLDQAAVAGAAILGEINRTETAFRARVGHVNGSGIAAGHRDLVEQCRNPGRQFRRHRFSASR